MHEFFAGIDYRTGVPLFDDFVAYLEPHSLAVARRGVASLPDDHPARAALEQEYAEFVTLPENVRYLILFIQWMADHRSEQVRVLEGYVAERMSAIPLDAAAFRSGLRIMLRKPEIWKEIRFLRIAYRLNNLAAL
ncbi:MAG TPA: hypothetical protein VLB83_02230 [Candidatus Paceibacterota bacterium]|nr:hypothetical protein [Candidatus Paceibacterota bacterium]